MWVIGVVSASATLARVWKPRSACAVRRKWRASYSWPPNTLTTLWQSMLSCSTCTISPIERITPREARRMRCEMARTVQAIGGTMAKVISVSFQLRIRSQVSRPTMAIESLITTVSTVVAAPVRSEEHTSELQSLTNLVCRLLLEKKKKKTCMEALVLEFPTSDDVERSANVLR